MFRMVHLVYNPSRKQVQGKRKNTRIVTEPHLSEAARGPRQSSIACTSNVSMPWKRLQVWPKMRHSLAKSVLPEQTSIGESSNGVPRLRYFYWRLFNPHQYPRTIQNAFDRKIVCRAASLVLKLWALKSTKRGVGCTDGWDV